MQKQKTIVNGSKNAFYRADFCFYKIIFTFIATKTLSRWIIGIINNKI